MLFHHEYPRKLKAGFIGSGDHAFRNILPCFQYLPFELVALADTERERGVAVARQFGVRRFYPDHAALLAREAELDAVFVVVPPDADGRPRYPAVAADVLRAGRHVWVDAPPCADSGDVSTYTDACSRSGGKYVLVGFKRMFAPATLKVEEIIQTAAFGGAGSYSLRYPVTMPAPDQRQVGGRLTTAFLEFLQPYSLVLRLFGEAEGLSYARSTANGDAVITLAHRGGWVGTLHLTGAQAATSPLERLEVVGQGGNVIVENGVRLTYYRPGGQRGQGEPGRTESFIGPDAMAPILWEPDLSLGQLYNKQLFLQGYVGCLAYMAQQLLASEPFRQANLVHMLHAMNVHDRLLRGAEHTWLVA